MVEIKEIISDLRISALENNIKLAGLAVISTEGNLIYQTENWDLSNQIRNILYIIKGDNPFVLNNIEFTVVKSTSAGIIGTNQSGMGHVIFVFFQGGILIANALPQANPDLALSFLKKEVNNLDGKL